MNQHVLSFKRMKQFTEYLFDLQDLALKAATILKAILRARSPRLSDISQAMPGNPEANYKAIQRFLAASDPPEALIRLYQEEAPFILADPTDIERPQAEKTDYVGRLKSGRRGFLLLILAVPYGGRALPFHFITYSAATLASEGTSRNLEHRRALGEVKELLGDKPVVLDREFSYQTFFEDFVAEGMKFVIRLNIGLHPSFSDEEGKRVDLGLAPGQRVFYGGLFYQGKVKVNVAGEWRKGFKKPWWVITNLEPEEGLRVYRGRMKIEESFKDLKNLLGLEKLMNKKREYMEKVVALVLLAYAIGLLIGEAVRDRMYGDSAGGGERGGNSPQELQGKKGKKWELYSGLFILLKQKIRLGRAVLCQLIASVLESFRRMVYGDVRSYV